MAKSLPTDNDLRRPQANFAVLVLLERPRNLFLLAFVIYLMAISGLISLLISLLFRKYSEKFFVQTIAKSLVAVCRFVSAVVGFALNSPTAPDQNTTETFLTWTRWVAPVSWLFWELVGVIAESRSKAVITRIAVLEKNLLYLRKLLTLIGDAVATKRVAIAKVALSINSSESRTNLDSPGHLNLIKEAMAPNERVFDLLRSLTVLLERESRSTARTEPQYFRACLYIEEDGFMVEKTSFDSRTQNEAGMKSYANPTSRHRFQVNNTADPAVIVECIQQERPIIITDCDREQKLRGKKKPSFYFHEPQKRYLKSLICYPYDFGHDPKKPRWSALAVDTNRAGHFSDVDGGFFETCFVEYLKRIDLELVYEELFFKSVDLGRRSSSR